MIYRCYSPSCASYDLACDSDSRIIIDERSNNISYGRKDANTSCEAPQCNDNPCCMKNSTDLLEPVSHEYRLQVYKNCSNEQSCVLNPPSYSPDDSYHYIQYPIFCQPKNTIISLMDTRTVSNVFELGLYFSGKKTPTQGLSCSCNISSQANIGIVVWFLNLRRESCPKIQLISEQLNCSSGGVFIPYGGIDRPIDGTHKSIKLDDLTSSPDDVFFVLFHTSNDKNITASCRCYLPGLDTIFVDILHGPVVNVPKDTIVKVGGDDLILTCTVQSNPRPFSLKWYKPDGTSTQGRELVISNIQKNETGVYSCEAISTLVPSNGSSITRSDNKPTVVTLEPEEDRVSGTVIGLSTALSLMTVAAILAVTAVVYLLRKTRRKDSDTDTYLPPIMARPEIDPQMTRKPEEDYVNNAEMYDDLENDTRIEPQQSVYQGLPKYINQRTKSSNKPYDGNRRSTNEGRYISIKSLFKQQ
ncbi:hypothetical protein SNE40_020767 [Patella caerulea]|uniref:Ig-like domain-containing protein n=1 Tax=Patella caerulea TaxID=87958 RepID=A0AAN8J5Q8_PATCE